MSYSRRRFLSSSTGAAAAVLGGRYLGVTQSVTAASLGDRIYKSVKWRMVNVKGTILEKFQLQRELGFDGVELVSPWKLDRGEVIEASRKTGMPVHGVVDMVHWNDRLSSPDESVRGWGLAALRQALRDAHFFGGSSVLLVPGKVTGNDENHDHVWRRSVVEIRKVLPLASRLGVRILIENVWNGFCETPEQFRDYVDEIDSPWVGIYFDIGNVRKLGPSEEWIRVLGSRIVKLDVERLGRIERIWKNRRRRCELARSPQGVARDSLYRLVYGGGSRGRPRSSERNFHADGSPLGVDVRKRRSALSSRSAICKSQAALGSFSLCHRLQISSSEAPVGCILLRPYGPIVRWSHYRLTA